MNARTRVGLLLAVLSLCLLTGCGSTWEYDPITDVNDLEGRRVGVVLSWESDYCLTGREDLELYRYDEMADMIMALSYDKVDALAIDANTWSILANLSDGVERSEPAGYMGYIMYLGADDKALAEDINLFLKEFRQTEEYRDLVNRVENFDGIAYEGPDIPLTGTGDVIHVAIDPVNYPRAFKDVGSDVPVGYDLEVLKHYANARGYQVDFNLAGYTSCIMGLQSGIYDIFVGYLGEIYAEEVLSLGLNVTDSMYELPMYYVQKTQERISVDTDALS